MGFSNYIDVPPEHEYYREISILSSLGTIVGHTNNTFMPDNIITRAEYGVILFRALGLDISPNALEIEIKDMVGHWGQQHVATLVELGILSLYDDGTFNPNVVMVMSLQPDYTLLDWKEGKVSIIQGKVTLDDGESASNIKVVLYDENSNPVYAVNTNSEGQYIFVNVPLGIYSIRTEKLKYYLTDKIENIRVAEVETVVVEDLSLQFGDLNDDNIIDI